MRSDLLGVARHHHALWTLAGTHESALLRLLTGSELGRDLLLLLVGHQQALLLLLLLDVLLRRCALGEHVHRRIVHSNDTLLAHLWIWNEGRVHAEHGGGLTHSGCSEHLVSGDAIHRDPGMLRTVVGAVTMNVGDEERLFVVVGGVERTVVVVVGDSHTWLISSFFVPSWSANSNTTKRSSSRKSISSTYVYNKNTYTLAHYS